MVTRAKPHTEEFLRLVIDTIPTMAWSLGPDGMVDFVNQRWLDYTGLSLEQELEEPTRPIHPEDLPRATEKWRADIAAGKPFEDEMRLRRADGEYRWFLVRTAPLRDEQGQIVKWYGTSTDIEDRKRTEKGWQVLIDAIPQQIWSGAPDGTLDYCNARWRSYMGIGLKDLQGDGWQRMLHPNDRERVLKAWHESVVNGTPYGQEERHRGADGSYRWFLSLGVPLRDAEGRIVRWYGTHTDIEDRKQAEKALNAQARRYKTLMEASTDSIYVLDENGDLQEANEAFLRRRGYSAAEVKGSNVADWDARWTREQLQERLRKLVGGDAVFETRHRCKDGSIFDVEVCATSVRIAGEQLFFCVTRDITERKQAEQALRESEQRFRELAENINEVFWLSDDQNTQMHYISPTYEKVWGRSCESLYAAPRSWMDAVHPEDKQQVLATVVKRSLDETYHNTYRIVRPDGSIRWIRDRGFPVRDESGEAVRFAGIAEDITEGKTNAEALERAEKQYHSIFNDAIDGIFRTSPDGKFLVANPAAARIFGFDSPEQLIAERGDIAQQGYVDPGRREEFKRLIGTQGVVNSFEYEAYRRDGSRVWICENTRAVKSPSGEVLYFEGILEDVTDRKRAEEKLWHSLNLLRAITEGTTDAIYAKDREGRYLMINTAGARLVDKSPEEVIGLDDTQLFSVETAARILERDRSLLDSGVTRTDEDTSATPSGVLRTYLTTKGPLRDSSGAITGLFGVSRDVTQRKRANDLLRRSEERFRTIFEQAPLGISEGEIATARFINANQRYVDILGYTIDELRKLTFKDYTHPDDLQKDLVEFQKLAAGEIETYAMEKRYLRKDGAIIWVNLTVTGLARPGEKPRNCIAVIEDITERKRAAEQLEEANRQLRILSRQLFHMQEEERRHLARELHDEIGQTLTAAKINLKIIAPDVPAKISGRLEDSIQLLDRLLRQVRQLSLDLRPPLLDELGLVPTLRWLVDQQAQRAQLRATFTSNINGLEIDPAVQTTCFRVVQEAITNIIRHSGAKNVAVELRREAERLELSVRDDGAGFDPAVIQQRAARHSTLGLVSMKERALLVRGGLEVHSAPGQGTEIRAWFPLPCGERSSIRETE